MVRSNDKLMIELLEPQSHNALPARQKEIFHFMGSALNLHHGNFIVFIKSRWFRFEHQGVNQSVGEDGAHAVTQTGSRRARS